jgi:hypothetical protein
MLRTGPPNQNEHPITAIEAIIVCGELFSFVVMTRPDLLHT